MTGPQDEEERERYKELIKIIREVQGRTEEDVELDVRQQKNQAKRLATLNVMKTI